MPVYTKLNGPCVEVKVRNANDEIHKRIRNILEKDLHLELYGKITGTTTIFVYPKNHRDLVRLSYQKASIGNPNSTLLLEDFSVVPGFFTQQGFPLTSFV